MDISTTYTIFLCLCITQEGNYVNYRVTANNVFHPLEIELFITIMSCKSKIIKNGSKVTKLKRKLHVTMTEINKQNRFHEQRLITAYCTYHMAIFYITKNTNLESERNEHN